MNNTLFSALPLPLWSYRIKVTLCGYDIEIKILKVRCFFRDLSENRIPWSKNFSELHYNRLILNLSCA